MKLSSDDSKSHKFASSVYYAIKLVYLLAPPLICFIFSLRYSNIFTSVFSFASMAWEVERFRVQVLTNDWSYDEWKYFLAQSARNVGAALLIMFIILAPAILWILSCAAYGSYVSSALSILGFVAMHFVLIQVTDIEKDVLRYRERELESIKAKTIRDALERKRELEEQLSMQKRQIQDPVETERIRIEQEQHERALRLAQEQLAIAHWTNRYWNESSRDCVEIHLRDPSALRGQLFEHPLPDISLGAAMDNHAVIVGHPGSGKTYLLSTIIMRISHLYNPDEIYLTLLDFKMGVGFKPFSELPHAKVIGLDADRELGLSALYQVNEEINRRGVLFRSTGVENIAEYRMVTGDSLARWVVVMDEWTELVSIEDMVSKSCKSVIDRIIRLGRAFGIHLILASQSFPSSVLSPNLMQMITVRILLRCGNDDWSRVTGLNSGWFPNSVREPGDFYRFNATINAGEVVTAVEVGANKCTGSTRLRLVEQMAHADNRRPIVFDGSQETSFPEHPMEEEPMGALKLWLGVPLTTERHYGISFRCQAGSNITIVNRNDDLISQVLKNMLASENINIPEHEFLVIANDYLSGFNNVKSIGASNAIDVLAGLLDSNGMKTSSFSRTFVIIPKVEELRSLRDGYGKDRAILLNLLETGPAKGIHLIVGSSTVRSLTNHVGNRGLDEFSIRISGTLDDSESLALFDSTVASNILKENRYVCYDDSCPGEFHKFIPYKG